MPAYGEIQAFTVRQFAACNTEQKQSASSRKTHQRKRFGWHSFAALCSIGPRFQVGARDSGKGRSRNPLPRRGCRTPARASATSLPKTIQGWSAAAKSHQAQRFRNMLPGAAVRAFPACERGAICCARRGCFFFWTWRRVSQLFAWVALNRDLMR